MEQDQLTFHVFVSYNRKDNRYANNFITDIAKGAVSKANERFRESGEAISLTMWVDEDIVYGSMWQREIARQLSRSQILLSFTTSRYCQSFECQREVMGFLTGRYASAGQMKEDVLSSEAVEQMLDDASESMDLRVRRALERGKDPMGGVRLFVPILWEPLDEIMRGLTDHSDQIFASTISNWQGAKVSQYFDDNMTLDKRREKIENTIAEGLTKTIVGKADELRETLRAALSHRYDDLARQYLEKGPSMRELERKFLDINNGNGFAAKQILSDMGIAGPQKGLLSKITPEEAIAAATGTLRTTLLRLYGHAAKATVASQVPKAEPVTAVGGDGSKPAADFATAAPVPTPAAETPLAEPAETEPTSTVDDESPVIPERYLPDEACEMRSALARVNEDLAGVYLAVCRFVDDQGRRVRFVSTSKYVSLLLDDGSPKGATFGSLGPFRARESKMFFYLKPGARGYRYGAGEAELGPTETSPDGIFRNLNKADGKVMGHNGVGTLQVSLQPGDLVDGQLPQAVREAILDAMGVGGLVPMP